MKQLVCFGSCNPDRARIDDRVRVARHRTWGDSGNILPIDDDIARELRTLRHTPHEPVESPGLLEGFRCRDCGTIRTCGAKMTPPAE